jgi:hypothetical protein
MKNGRYLKVVIGKGLLEYIEKYDAVKLPVFNITFLQFHIYGSNCVWVLRGHNIDTEFKYF